MMIISVILFQLIIIIIKKINSIQFSHESTLTIHNSQRKIFGNSHTSFSVKNNFLIDDDDDDDDMMFVMWFSNSYPDMSMVTNVDYYVIDINDFVKVMSNITIDYNPDNLQTVCHGYDKKNKTVYGLNSFSDNTCNVNRYSLKDGQLNVISYGESVDEVVSQHILGCYYVNESNIFVGITKKYNSGYEYSLFKYEADSKNLSFQVMNDIPKDEGDRVYYYNKLFVMTLLDGRIGISIDLDNVDITYYTITQSVDVVFSHIVYDEENGLLFLAISNKLSNIGTFCELVVFSLSSRTVITRYRFGETGLQYIRYIHYFKEVEMLYLFVTKDSDPPYLIILRFDGIEKSLELVNMLVTGDILSTSNKYPFGESHFEVILKNGTYIHQGYLYLTGGTNPDDENIYQWNVTFQACKKGMFYRTENDICTECDTGLSTSMYDDISCSECDTGLYLDVVDYGCKFCGIGKYGDQNTKVEEDCKNCPAGTFSNSSNNVYSSSCIPCPIGTKSFEIGAISQSVCQACDEGVFCGLGSTTEIATEMLTKETQYSNIEKISKLLTQKGQFTLKLISWICGISICIVVLVIVAILSRFVKIKALQFQNFDVFYSQNHKVEVGKSPINIPSTCGGICSILAVFASLVLILSSTVNFIIDNQETIKETKFDIGRELDTIGRDFYASLLVGGNFDQCSATCNITGFDNQGSTTCIKSELLLGCECKWECDECLVEDSDVNIDFEFHNNGHFVSYIHYEIGFPHPFPDQEYFVISSTHYEEESHIDSIAADVSLLKSFYIHNFFFNLFTSTIGYEYIQEFQGYVGSIISKNIETTTSVSSNLQIIFQIQVSFFTYYIREIFSQTLLSFLGEIFALSSLCIAFFGILFSTIDKYSNTNNKIIPHQDNDNDNDDDDQYKTKQLKSSRISLLDKTMVETQQSEKEKEDD